MRSPQRILYQQHCAECARSYTYRHNFKREPTHACACMYDYMQSSEHAWVQWRRAQGRAIIARSRARTRSPISSSSIELLYMKMRDNIPANWRTCMGALQTRARAKKDPQEGQKRPRDTSTVSADISSETKRTRCGVCTCKPLRLGHIAGDRDRGLRTPNDHCRETFLPKQAFTRKCARALTRSTRKW